MQHTGILLLGPTGTGKTPLGDYLAQNGLAGQACRHFDFGAQLRHAVDDGGLSTGHSGMEIAFLKGVLEEGRLLDDHHFSIAEKILRYFLGQKETAGALVVLNGLPRHTGQARGIAELVKVKLVISLDCRPEDVLERIRTNAGGDRTERTDDNLELVGRKLEIYRQQTLPLVEFYRAGGTDIRKVNIGPRTRPPEIVQQLDKILI